ncbi:MAG: Type secretion system outer membrane protein [Alphaproteobacteria bacterium]|jgi:adhesin transport system outer membrane protein|nr:Type secretion system outer membrane protein [Alphaproteobacteria bacterium]
MIRKNLTKFGSFFISSVVICGIVTTDAYANLQRGSLNNKTSASDPFDAKISSKDDKYNKPPRISTATLSGIVQEALKYHPGIEADKEALSATGDAIDQAQAGYMPSVDLRVSLGRENMRRNFNANALNPLSSAGTITTTRSDPSITIRQILFDGMGTASRVARARSQRHQAHGTLGVTTDTATVDAASVTIDVRRLHRLLRIVDHNIRFHQIMKARIEEIVQAGAAPISDLFQIESRLQDTFVSKSNIVSELEVARAKFIEAVGKAPPDYIQRINLPSYLTPTSADMAVRMALDNNSSIKVAKSSVQIAETNHRETGSKLVPTITLELEGERDRNMGGTSGFQNRLTAMVVARHNLFNGGADFAKSRETVKRLTETHARLNLARRQTERTIRAAWAEAKNARAKSAHLTNLIREKRRIRDSYVNEFALGKRTLIDILDAANDVFLTEASRTTVDATADVNTVILSVGTAQFKGYINRTGKNEADGDESHNLAPYTSDLDPSLRFTPYRAMPQKISKVQKNHKVKNMSLKRKSIFEMRKESRKNEAFDKSNA